MGGLLHRLQAVFGRGQDRAGVRGPGRGPGGGRRLSGVQAGHGSEAGDKVYRVNRGKSVMLAVMGRKGLEEGVNIGAAHIDSPRLD